MNLPFKSGYKDVREAADAGLLLWRNNFIYFLPFFAIPFWICAFSVRFIPIHPYWFSLIIWWLKPLFDRLILHVIQVRFFENGANMKRIRIGLWQTLKRALFGDLLWRRFSPMRATVMPVRILEQNTKNISERKKILKQGGTDYCFFLTLWGVAVETALLIGEILFVSVMIGIVKEGLFSSLEDFTEKEIFIYTAWCINYILIETMYICMGFSVYINSRIEVEGWDIELTFRNLAAQKKKSSSIKKSALIGVCLLFLLFPAKVSADDMESNSGSAVPLEQLKSIMDSPDFGGEKDSWGIRRKNQKEETPQKPWNFRMDALREFFASALRIILVCVLVGLIVFPIVYFTKHGQKRRRRIDDPVIHALKEIPLENPEILLKKAISFHEKNELRLAWGYCAASAIISWQLYKGFAFPPNATENECAKIVNSMAANDSANNEEAEKFAALIKCWVYLAYAGINPSEGSFEKAAVFCKSLQSIGLKSLGLKFGAENG